MPNPILMMCDDDHCGLVSGLDICIGDPMVFVLIWWSNFLFPLFVEVSYRGGFVSNFLGFSFFN